MSYEFDYKTGTKFVPGCLKRNTRPIIFDSEDYISPART